MCVSMLAVIFPEIYISTLVEMDEQERCIDGKVL